MISKIVTLTAPGFESLQGWLRKLGREGLPPDAREVHRNHRNTVYTVSADGQQLSVKAFGIPDFTDSIVYANLADSMARRSLDNALTLRRLGIETPKPVGAVEVIENGRLTRSYYISRHINVVGDMRDWDANPVADAAVADLAALMVRLHTHGVLHKNFSPDNIIIKHDRRGRRHLLVISLDRMEFGVFDHSRHILNFERIYPENGDETARLARLYARFADLDETATVREAEDVRRKYMSRKSRKHRLKAILNRNRKKN